MDLEGFRGGGLGWGGLVKPPKFKEKDKLKLVAIDLECWESHFRATSIPDLSGERPWEQC